MTDLPADRELDALVAKKVMGWSALDLIEKNRFYGDGDFEGFFGTGIPPGLAVPYRIEIPHYSTSIAAAWDVVEKFSGFEMQKMANGYFVAFSNGSAEADTAPLVICRAALKAVGVRD